MPAFYYSIGARYYKCERFTITMEVSCMKTQRRTADEQYQLIMECAAAVLVTTNGVQNITSIPAPFTTGLKD